MRSIFRLAPSSSRGEKREQLRALQTACNCSREAAVFRTGVDKEADLQRARARAEARLDSRPVISRRHGHRFSRNTD